jgi:hypothetical protein
LSDNLREQRTSTKYSQAKQNIQLVVATEVIQTWNRN